MNTKSKEFDTFLKSEEIYCFDSKPMEDEEHTVVYRSYVQTEIGDMPIFVMLDDTAFSIVRVAMGNGAVNADNQDKVYDFMNRENNNYKSFKYYVDTDDNSLYLDCVYICGPTHFEPQLLYALMNQIVHYIPGVVADLRQVLGIEQLPDPFGQEHNHEEQEAEERVIAVTDTLKPH